MNEKLYRQAEQKLWAYAGLTPAERRIRLASAGVQVRVQEVGEGPPVLFIHPGGPNAGATWALLAARLAHLRCMLLDRPGSGLSEPLRLDAATVEPLGDRFVGDVLDALGIERADLVASSIGGYIALRSGAVQPDRVGRIMMLGFPPLMPGGKLPLVMRFMVLPGVWRLLCNLQPSDGAMRTFYQQFGHGPTLEANPLPRPLWDWQMALQRYTDNLRNEYAQNVALASFWRGPDSSVILDGGMLRSIGSPVYFLIGPDDPFGDAGVAERVVVGLRNAELEILPGAGHWPWLDDLDHAASVIRRFLDVDRRSRRSA